jgi:hypothetical protein
MITQGQIEAKGFVVFNERGPEPFVTVSTEYIALGTLKETQRDPAPVRPLILRYFESGRFTISDYFNDPLLYSEYYALGTLETTDDLDGVLDRLVWSVTAIDLTKLTTDYA